MKKNLSEFTRKRTRTPPPLESFDPRYRKILLAGLLHPIDITFPSYREAKRFQVRLHTFRSALSAHSPEDARVLYGVKTSIKSNILTIRPADAEFASIFTQLPGFDPPPNERTSIDVPPITPVLDEGSTEITFTDLLSDLDKL
jgi:hypothetical protein